ncbi:F-BAR domain only protein 2 isoform X2 [Paramormyrops kingsleyae]|uniref:F-BAR domain only protein 2 isoform X2 n=1 Tax=Paramormyrops kingsleyae TaxID=1676925 RepID=UPI000CD6203B|nr:F-BAR domain only protein 2 isoform X2 [Paramormyrops kingsleyae]
MIMAYFLENFWGEKNNGFDVLYHNMKHGQISTKELSEFIRERATIEEAYARSMTRLSKSASNFSQLGTFAPVWDVYKTSTEQLASCHLELVRKLQELMKEVQKYADDQAKAHKKTKEEVATTLEAVQNIQTISQALQKSKENYNAKTVDQERLRKEGATQKEVDKAGVKAKKATEVYKSCVEKYATAKSEFEQKMAETAQKFQGIEENHILHMKEIIQSYSQSIEETHIQIGEVHKEFVNNMENTTVESLIQKLAESKGTGKDRPGPIEFEECNISIATEGTKPRKRKAFAIPGRRKDKDTDSTESAEAESTTSNGAPPGSYGTIDLQNANVLVDDEGFCIRPEVNENDAKENSFYSSSDSDDEDEPRKFHVAIKPVQPNNGNHQTRSSIDELKASIGNITLSPSASSQMRRNQSSDELAKSRVQASCNDRPVSSDLLSLDPFGPPLAATSVSSSTECEVCPTSDPAKKILHKEGPPFSAASSPSPWPLNQTLLGLNPLVHTKSPSPVQPDMGDPAQMAPESMDIFSSVSWSQSQWIAFDDEFAPCRRSSSTTRDPTRLPLRTQAKSIKFFSDDPSDPYNSIMGGSGSLFEEPQSTVKLSPNSGDETFTPSAIQMHHALPLHARPTTPLAPGTLVPPPRPSSRPKLPTGKLAGINEIVRPFSPPKISNASPPPTAPLARAESSSSLSSNTSLSAGNTPTVDEDVFIGKLPSFEKRCDAPSGTSRGPSPVTLASQDSIPVAVAFTESVNAYFKGADPTKCIVKITGDVTLSFPSGIMKIFTSNPSPAVLSFKLKNTVKLEQILPNQQILYSDPSQSNSGSKDFWLNMQSLTAYLRKLSEQNPAASYYNVDILKYQVVSNGIQSTPLNLAVYWKCSPTSTDLRVDYKYNPESMLSPSPLTNVQVLVPVDGGVTNMQSLPVAIWNAEQSKSLWKLNDISEKSENEGSGSLRAKFDLSEGPSNPATLAVQFLSEGGTLSGVDLELVGTGYRLSLTKKRFATGRYMADC